MYRSRNQNCYCKCYCNQKIFHFERMLWSWKYHCWCWSPRAQIEFPYAVDVPQPCLHHCESHPHWSWYQSLSQRIFLFGRVCQSGKLQYFLQYFWLLYCLFHFGRVYQSGNEQCYWWWSRSRSSALMVHLGGCDLVLLAGMVLTLLTGSPANWVWFFSLMALFSGYSVSAI